MNLTPNEAGSIVGVIAGLVGGGGTSLASSFRAGVKWGNIETRITVLEGAITNMATKDQVAGLKEDVAEIKGMFTMVLKDGTN